MCSQCVSQHCFWLFVHCWLSWLRFNLLPATRIVRHLKGSPKSVPSRNNQEQHFVYPLVYVHLSVNTLRFVCLRVNSPRCAYVGVTEDHMLELGLVHVYQSWQSCCLRPGTISSAHCLIVHWHVIDDCISNWFVYCGIWHVMVSFCLLLWNLQFSSPLRC